MGKRAQSAAATPKKTFSLHWGSGVVEEEATIGTPHHRPCIQLLQFTDGEAAGQQEIRFCFYDHRGRFQRAPMIIDEAYLEEMRAALERAPKLKALLKRMVG